jgi:hypothetical protein
MFVQYINSVPPELRGRGDVESSAAVKTPAITGRRVGCFAVRSPDGFYPEDADLRVVGRDRHPGVLALRGEHAIERIAVLLRP